MGSLCVEAMLFAVGVVHLSTALLPRPAMRLFTKGFFLSGITSVFIFLLLLSLPYPVSASFGGGYMSGLGEALVCVLLFIFSFITFLILVFKSKRTHRKYYLVFHFVVPVLYYHLYFLSSSVRFSLNQLGAFFYKTDLPEHWYAILAPLILIQVTALMLYFVRERPIAALPEAERQEKFFFLGMNCVLAGLGLLILAHWTYGIYLESTHRIKRMAEAGLVNSQWNLALRYENGDRVPHDDAQAAFWYRKAADQGNALSQAALAQMFSEGRGVPKNERQAARLNLAAAISTGRGGMSVAGANGQAVRNYNPYQRVLALPPNVIAELIAELEQKDPHKAVAAYELMLSYPGKEKAQYQYRLAERRENGKDTRYDPSGALELYKRAAQNGLPEAQEAAARLTAKLPTLYRERELAQLLYFTARLYLIKEQCFSKPLQQCQKPENHFSAFRSLAEQGYIAPQLIVAALYAQGIDGAFPQWQEAKHWLTAAAAQNDPTAQFFLGEMYTEGVSVVKDRAEAEKWYRAAVEPRKEQVRDERMENIVRRAQWRLTEINALPTAQGGKRAK